MGKVVQLARGRGLDCKTMLLSAAGEADRYEDVVIICRNKDDSMTRWSTSLKSWFLFGCASILQDLANDALNGRIQPEE